LILVAQKSSFLRTLLSSIKRSNRTKVSTRILNILTNVFQSDEIPSTTLPRSESRSLFLKLVRTCQVVAIEAQDFTSQRCSLRGICDISRRPCPRGACSPVFKNKPVSAAGISMAVGHAAAFTLASGLLPCLQNEYFGDCHFFYDNYDSNTRDKAISRLLTP
jgi:hypothetical protein